MAVTAPNTGTQAATLTTEHTLATITSEGVYVLNVDTNPLVNGETLTLRAYYITLSGGTERLAYTAVYRHAQSEPSKFSIPIPTEGLTGGLRFTLRQDGGTGRSYPWKVMKL